MNNNQIINNTAMGANNDDQTPVPPVSLSDYQETLGKLSHDEIVAQLMENGLTKDAAEAFAKEFDEDR